MASMLMEDHRIADAKRKGMATIMGLLELTDLKRVGSEHIGPCPGCGGTDRFAINTRKSQFICRKCGGKGDEIGLVMFVRHIGFAEALDWLCGPEQKLTAAERDARANTDAKNRLRKAAEAAAFRANAVREAREIWAAGRPAEGSPVRDYLALRGITAGLLTALPVSLRFAPQLAFMVPGSGSGQWIEAHRGPAMLAAIQGPDGRFSAVHRTWFDLAAPQGKIVIRHPLTDEVQKRKKSWGAKKGGAIRLSPGIAPVLVMGEGIETTLSARIAGIFPDAVFWAGVDLGNMSGQKQSGPGLRFAGLPDLGDDAAFVPPPWVERLIFIRDGDSDPRATTAALESGLRRAMALRPGLRGQIAPCPDGLDLNDVLIGSAS